ncbi:ABC transporter permease [Egibacter rhizosphaerae]|uniref:ABC transporter permease n=1 Tax=Egibacter rhizosphaerae TaxID=1670831 RepID=A0A411YD69_9ACTN|nr:ABC transporter permease [Egibacter rhizosphaerae]QBI19150.1 ABC transporter permease [Egibacter rhizosphaerae]
MSDTRSAAVASPAEGGDAPAATGGGPARIRRLWQSASGLVGVLLTVTMVVTGGLAALGLTMYDPTAQDSLVRLEGPSAAHLLGTDQFGRDIASRVMFGIWSSLQVATLSVALAASLGTFVGLLAGYLGSWVDRTIMRVNDVFFAFPAILLALAIVSALGPGARNTALAIGIVFTPLFVRVARGPVLALRDVEFVQATRVLGFSRTRILLRHLLPNVASPVLVQIALAFSWAIITESSLSFLGLGTQPPMPSLGSMVSEGRSLASQAPWMLIAPSVAVVLAVVGLNLLGDALRDALDPRSGR